MRVELPSGNYGPEGRAGPALLDRLLRRVSILSGEREIIEVEAPFTGETLGRVPRGTEEDVVEAVRRAREAQKAWLRRPLKERTKVFFRFHDLVLERREVILDLIQLESGKARRNAFEEVLDAAIVARYYANTAREHLKPRRRQGAFPGFTAAREYRHPKGVAGFITPWNYPLSIGITDALPALLAGNGVVIKPDEKTPFTALWAIDLLYEAGLPPDLAQVVTGYGPEVGAAVVDNADFVMFTGSTETGRRVAAQTAERLVDYSMELGGKNALMVLSDADLEKAVAGAERAAFANAGQLCISSERFYIHTGIYDDFVRRFVERTRNLKLGSGLDYGPDMGSLVSASQLASVKAVVEDAIAKGARVLTGGRTRPDLGPYFYEPTVLEGVTPDMDLHAEETFGPVVALYRVTSPEEAVEKANDSRYGLNFSLWTRNTAEGRRLATRLEAGTVNVNEAYAAAWASVDAPMGGFKYSGVGRRHGATGIQKYTEPQTVALQRLLPIGAPPRIGDERYARLMAGALKLVRRLPGIR